MFNFAVRPFIIPKQHFIILKTTDLYVKIYNNL